MVWELELNSFNHQKRPSESFKVIGIGVIRLTITCDIIFVFHCNHVSISHHFGDAISYFPKFKEVT